MVANRSASRLVSISLVTLLAAFAVCAPTRAEAQTVVVLVGGEPITNLDIEQRTKLTTLTTHKAPPRQEVLQELIDEKLKIREGKKFGVDLSASDVDGAYSGMASRLRMNSDQLTKVLEAQGIRADTLKQRLKAETTWNALVRGRYKESLVVSEKDVQTAVASDAQPEQNKSFEYRVRPVVLFIPRGAAPAVVEQRRKEAETLRGKIQSCDDAEGYFRAMRDGTIRDLIVKTSADLPGAYRELLDKTEIGHMTAPEVTKQGVEMVVLCDRKTTTADTPAKRAARDKLFVQKYEAKSKAYLDDLRKGAMIEYR
ncbi:MAG: SurA N-terminal domain-containing protein [Xanthobacteraceae bacterium]|nr:SurA N-terminal domain-containing protein [Xanthobacteraceae bacterium]